MGLLSNTDADERRLRESVSPPSIEVVSKGARFQIDRREKLGARFDARAERSQHASSHHADLRLVNASCSHAFMRGLDHHANAERLEHDVETLGDLGGHFLLDLEPLGIDVNEPNELGNANNTIARKIADMHAADDWCDMVLAMGFKPNVAQQHDLVIARYLFEGPLQILLRVLEIAREPFFVRPHHARRRPNETLALRIVPGPATEGAYGGFGFDA